MHRIDRREFVTMTATAGMSAAFLPLWPTLNAQMAARIHAMRDALLVLDDAGNQQRADWSRYEGAGLVSQDGFWSWYKTQRSTVLYDRAIQDARNAVEEAFMTPTYSSRDEDAVMEALNAYEEIHPSAFWMQTARDLFTPLRFQTYPLEHIRHWLLTDPEEDFEKTGMPGFLRAVRAKQDNLLSL